MGQAGYFTNADRRFLDGLLARAPPHEAQVTHWLLTLVLANFMRADQQYPVR